MEGEADLVKDVVGEMVRKDLVSIRHSGQRLNASGLLAFWAYFLDGLTLMPWVDLARKDLVPIRHSPEMDETAFLEGRTINNGHTTTYYQLDLARKDLVPIRHSPEMDETAFLEGRTITP